MATQIRLAAAHVAPIFLSAHETTHKAIRLIEQAARNKANLIAFPESFISAFPIWSALRPPTENHDLFQRMVRESVHADGEEIQAVRATARKCNIIISLGFSEKARTSSATLFNSNIIIDNEGDVLVHHRKLVPTFFEKLTWSPGDGYGLRVADTKFGKIGALICGENTNPLARYALIAQGEQIHISTWPAIWPTRSPSQSGMEESDPQPGATERPNYDNTAANRIRASAHCFEAKCFGILCAGVLGRDAINIIASSTSTLKQSMEQSQRAATMFLDPTGAPIRGFVIDEATSASHPADFLQAQEGVLYADVDLDDCIEGKQYHDTAGGYQRMDVFGLQVNRTRQQPVRFTRVLD
ncbi:carbon-nitrogen hydrolase [Aspergillus pseudotamarii]|uniref:Carbon-nitrogen hydrolase n=1 Tax=Aspergillus pseudotamarii TaxID=132259 RepID=A0A5N6SYS4_ASPPS|nr:carbon-nitrogen hydrolase [Aspergillus pseudotamarii]KAE8138929.1 carbon-nitrogen hydrolase [Aspergillus pseudotamarii]